MGPDETIHEGHGFGGVVATAERNMDNRNCVVVDACYVPIYYGGSTGMLGRAVRTPKKKGTTAASKEVVDEDISTTTVSDVGVEDALIDGDSPETMMVFEDPSIALEVPEKEGTVAEVLEAITAFDNMALSEGVVVDATNKSISESEEPDDA